MPWNWERKDWPRFRYMTEDLVGLETQFLQYAGELAGSLKYIQEEEQMTIKVDLLSHEAYKTSKIEGEILDRSSIQSSIRRHLGLKPDGQRVSPAENGIAEMMVNLYKTYDLPLTEDMLFSWHQMLMEGRRDIIEIGRYRSHEDPMQVVSGRMDRPTVHFEAPPSARVKHEMDVFIQWFNDTHLSHSILIRAGIAHLYFESIHPFEDGNGRLGRAISEKVLSQGLGRPVLLALSHTIERNKKDYYTALHQNSSDLDITPWLRYFSETVLQAQQYAQQTVDFVISKGQFYTRFAALLNERQHKVVARIFQEGVNGFQGGLSADNYMRIAKTTASTATRDLQKMIEIGAVKKTGQLKGTRYFLNL
ncbi:MAG: Fic family protein [Saprospiraceae bacterium]